MMVSSLLDLCCAGQSGVSNQEAPAELATVAQLLQSQTQVPTTMSTAQGLSCCRAGLSETRMEPLRLVDVS